MKRIIVRATPIAIALLLAACATPGGGGMADSLAFGKFNSAMDTGDKQKAIDAVRANKTDSWTNESSGNRYTVASTRTFTGDMGTCRDYRIDGMVSGKEDSFTGTACTGPRGFWQPSNAK